MQTRRNCKIPILTTGIFLIFGIGICLLSADKARADLADYVVVNEIQTDSISGAGGTNDDWVELYNPTAGDIVLDGWSIQKTSSSGLASSIRKTTLSGTIAAGGYLLIVRETATTTLTEMADILALDSFSLADHNIVYLVNNDVNITDYTDENIIDFVGFGTASYYEGSGAAPNPPDTKSIARYQDGEDTDNNDVDFVVQDNPTPQNSEEDDDGVDGTVLVTITPNAQPVQNIGPTSADIVFQVNSDGNALINYGLDDSYGSSTVAEAISANIDKTISLDGLNCETTYHYSIYAENTSGDDSDNTIDATFTTLPCGIVVHDITITKTAAKANDVPEDGWEWVFDITVWDTSETILKMKFDQWDQSNGVETVDAGGNMQFSVDNGVTWFNITANGDYPALGADISGIGNDDTAGRQVAITVRMKVPVGTLAGHYDSSYGILTEQPE